MADSSTQSPAYLDFPREVPGDAVIIGLYGISGCGKSFLLRQLQSMLPEDSFVFYEGSEMIDRCTQGGIKEFKKLGKEEQVPIREMAIELIRQKTLESGKTALVAGHCLFWEEDSAPWIVSTKSDWAVFTHIIYLNLQSEVISCRRVDDASRSRRYLSLEQISRWRTLEERIVRAACLEHKILFISLSSDEDQLAVLSLVLHWSGESEAQNLLHAKRRMDDIVKSNQKEPRTYLVFDADKTLAPQDSSQVFFQKLLGLQGESAEVSPLRNVFSSPFQYSFDAFRQAILLYEEKAPSDARFSMFCSMASSLVTMYPEVVAFIQQAAQSPHVGIVIITCGLRLVWEAVLERVGLSEQVALIAGGRRSDGIVVTPDVKSALVSHLKEVHQKTVCAFGDSPLDLPMLGLADLATVVVGAPETRSKGMDRELKAYIADRGLFAIQALLPETTAMRLDASLLPIVPLEWAIYKHMEFALTSHVQRGLKVTHATATAASKLLATSTRDAGLQGPALGRAHFNVGWYLAVNFLGDELGLEEFDMQHVQGNTTKGHGLRSENKTLIVALMRGGDPMARGVFEAFPRATLSHAFKPSKIKPKLVAGCSTVVLVDSVINSGTTMVKFVQRIRKLDASVRIVMMAGVAQSRAVAAGGTIDKAVGTRSAGKLSLIALRLSDNQYTGRGGTDTGNRLFNTTHLD